MTAKLPAPTCSRATAGVKARTGPSGLGPVVGLGHSGGSQLLLSNVGTMRTCSVLRCQNSGSRLLLAGGRSTGIEEVYVCSGHAARIDAGSPWDLCGDDVLVDQEMAPALLGWSLLTGRGTKGFTLVFDIAGRPEPIKVFLTPAESKSLALFLYPSSGLPLPLEVVEAFMQEVEEDAD